jgi:hypothetical protein
VITERRENDGKFLRAGGVLAEYLSLCLCVLSVACKNPSLRCVSSLVYDVGVNGEVLNFGFGGAEATHGEVSMTEPCVRGGAFICPLF